MANALRVIRIAPNQDHPGWNWLPTLGHHILAELQIGLSGRINRRGLRAQD